MTSAEEPSRKCRAVQRLSKVSVPYWFLVLAIIGGWVASIVVGVRARDPDLAKFVQVGLTPFLTFFAGSIVTDVYHRLGEDKRLTSDVGKSAYATLVMLQGVLSVDKRLADASDDLNEGNREGAATSIEVALAVTRVTLRQVLQSLRLWGSLSPKAVEQAKSEYKEDETAIGSERQQIAIESPGGEEVGNGNG